MELKTSLIDWIGQLEGGVGAFIGITIDNKETMEAVYWTHPDGRRNIQAEPSFLELFKVKKEEDLSFFEDLLDDIESILPEKEKIYEQFLKNSTD